MAKKIFFSLLSVLLLTYLAFIFIVPNLIDLNKNKAIIQKNLLDATSLRVDYDKVSVYGTPYLGLGFKFNNFVIKFYDNWDFVKAKTAVFEISAPSLLLKNINFNKMNLDTLNVNYVIGKTGKSQIDRDLDHNINFTFVKNIFKSFSITPSDLILTNYDFGIVNQQNGKLGGETGKKLVYPKSKVAAYISSKAKDSIKVK